MKKILGILVSLLLFATCADAANMIKTYYDYELKNVSIAEITSHFNYEMAGEKSVKKLTSTPNAYYAVYGPEHYYLKFYPANGNTHLFIASDASYSKDNNVATEFFKKYNMQYSRIKDKAARNEYENDFITYARTGALDGFFVFPDCFKPLKTGMSKLNDKISKSSKKDSAIPYSKDTEPINLTCVDTQCYTNEAAQIGITTKEYRLKNKENKYVHAYEYVLKNNADTNVVVDKVTSKRLAGMKDITTQTFVDLDRLDLIDTVGSFPPVAVCTCGLSLLCSVPNWVRLAKVTKESIRYAHTLPANQTITPNGTLRILVLKFKDDPQPLDFTVTREGQTHQFSF